MPNPNITTSYAGQWAGKYVSAAICVMRFHSGFEEVGTLAT